MKKKANGIILREEMEVDHKQRSRMIAEQQQQTLKEAYRKRKWGYIDTFGQEQEPSNSQEGILQEKTTAVP